MADLVRASVLGLPTSLAVEMDDVVRLVAQRLKEHGPLLATFVNPASVALADANAAYRGSLFDFDLVLPDGIGFAKAAQWLYGQPAARISFDSTSLAIPILSEIVQQRSSVALVGGEPGIASAARDRLLSRFPTLRVIDVLDGYGDLDHKLDYIAQRAPKVVLCGMGAGAQENFLLRLRARGWGGCGFTCGGYLDQLSAGFQYYPVAVNRLQLRWAYRLWREPRRLWRRYAVQYPRFFAKLAARLLLGERPQPAGPRA